MSKAIVGIASLKVACLNAQLIYLTPQNDGYGWFYFVTSKG